MPRRHRHEYSALWGHFGRYGPQDVHYHPCVFGDAGDGDPCGHALIGPGRTCSGDIREHHGVSLGNERQVRRAVATCRKAGKPENWRVYRRDGHATTAFWPVRSSKRPGSIHYIHVRPAVGWEICTRESGGGVTMRGAAFKEALALLADMADEVRAAQKRIEDYAEDHEQRWRARRLRFQREGRIKR